MMQPAPDRPSPAEPDDEGESFAIVGLGASAGGLAALEEFFRALPTDGSDLSMCFVVVQHLDPDHESMLLEILRDYTRLTVSWAEDGTAVEPGHVYVMPRNSEMAILAGRLRLAEPQAQRGLRLPIDHFFRSLATDAGERAVGVVLSGTGSDGTIGVGAIKGEGGIVIAQQPETAGYDGMPRSVISNGLADYVLAPRDMPTQLLDYARRAFSPARATQSEPETYDLLPRIILVLRDQTGHDFSHYKPNTVRRRIERRMALMRIERMGDYLALLARDPIETETLFRELLIGVTAFFRDKEAFEALQERVIRPLVASKRSGETIRVWVAGCSTGEEAYSIAILLHEAVAETKRRIPVQIFATDIDLEAIERARAGTYPDNIRVDVSDERLDRYFVASDSGFRIADQVRDSLVFAKQDLTRDPPFSKVDLISCRNLLIYLDTPMQRRLIPLFHYALNPGGHLFLGTSETIGDAHGAFSAVDRKWKIYERKSELVTRPAPTPLVVPPFDERVGRRGLGGATRPRTRDRLRDVAERALLDRHSPAAVVINAEGEVLYIHGHTGKYLEPATGEATSNLLKLAREGLRFELAAGMRKALAGREVVRHDRLRVPSNGSVSTVNLVIEPLARPDEAKGMLLVLFEDVASEHDASDADGHVVPDDAQQRIADLDRELSAKEDFLRATVEELETSNEELKSTNEELQSSNEELQSTIEELETSKEELQSVNEELVTVNSELQQKIEQLSQANNDMNNLLAGTGVGTLFVDHQLRIQRFTPAVTDIIKVIGSDVGRPLGDIALRLKGDHDLVELAKGVLATLVSTQAEVEVEDGRAYIMRVQPYRTLENVIEGAVISFVDVTEQRDLRLKLQHLAVLADEARNLAENVVNAVRDPILVLDGRLTIVSANEAFYTSFGLSSGSVIGESLDAIEGGPWADSDLRNLLLEILPTKGEVEEFAVTYETAQGRRTVRLSTHEVAQGDDPQRRLILLVADVSSEE
jgi:two-component system CheB/CheR fusion protein